MELRRILDAARAGRGHRARRRAGVPGGARDRGHLRGERAAQGAGRRPRTPGCRRSRTTPGWPSTRSTGCPGCCPPAGPATARPTRATCAWCSSRPQHVPDARRGAAFVCAAALVTPDGAEQVAHGTVTGTLLRAPRGSERLRLRPDLPARRRHPHHRRDVTGGEGRDQPPGQGVPGPRPARRGDVGLTRVLVQQPAVGGGELGGGGRTPGALRVRLDRRAVRPAPGRSPPRRAPARPAG